MGNGMEFESVSGGFNNDNIVQKPVDGSAEFNAQYTPQELEMIALYKEFEGVNSEAYKARVQEIKNKY